MCKQKELVLFWDSFLPPYVLTLSIKSTDTQSALRLVLFTMTKRVAHFQPQMACVNPNSTMLEAAPKKTVIFSVKC